MEVTRLKDKKIKAVQRLKNKLTKENLWLYVLRLLQEGPKYGYELRKQIKERFDFSPGKVTSYTVLYLLRREGLVRVRKGEKEGGKPARKYYEITEKGREAMRIAKEVVNELLARVFDLT